MPEVRHLSRAPITEAAINFQVDASPHWDPKTVREVLSSRWIDCPTVQEIRPVQLQIQFSPPGASAKPVAKLPVAKPPETQGFMFRGKDAIYQARRDGFTFSRLAPYEDWDSLTTKALAGWHDFQGLLQPRELHGVSIRFLNQLQFDLAGFSASRYFTVPPKVPPDLKWRLHAFHQQAFYAPPDSPCLVSVQTAPAFVSDPLTKVAFILSIEVILTQSLSALDRQPDSVLLEMRELKNAAFFNLLTEEAIQRYV